MEFDTSFGIDEFFHGVEMIVFCVSQRWRCHSMVGTNWYVL